MNGVVLYGSTELLTKTLLGSVFDFVRPLIAALGFALDGAGRKLLLNPSDAWRLDGTCACSPYHWGEGCMLVPFRSQAKGRGLMP